MCIAIETGAAGFFYCRRILCVSGRWTAVNKLLLSHLGTFVARGAMEEKTQIMKQANLINMRVRVCFDQEARPPPPPPLPLGFTSSPLCSRPLSFPASACHCQRCAPPRPVAGGGVYIVLLLLCCCGERKSGETVYINDPEHQHRHNYHHLHQHHRHKASRLAPLSIRSLFLLTSAPRRPPCPCPRSVH